jgi:acyl-CoA reductase-like NAD-dependent aldehyde dehydrogenase
MRASSAFLRTGRSFILGGEAAETGKLMNVTDKFTGAVAGSVHLAGPAELDRAAQLAHSSLPSTTALPAFERKAILRHLANRLNAMTDDIAVLLAIEAGKPVKDARVEVTRSVETFELAAEACVTAMYGQYGKMETSKRNQGLQFMTRRFPIGPVSMVTPFNFPLMLAAHKVLF